MSSRRRRHLVTAAAALGGIALFTWSIRQAGYANVVDGVVRVGWGLVPILVLAGLRFLARAEAWRNCMPRESRLPRHRAFAAFLAGDAIGNVTPFGPLVSEPTKVYVTRDRLAPRDAISSLALDNLIYGASIVVMLSVGAFVIVSGGQLPIGWMELAGGVAAALLAAAWVVPRLLHGTWDEKLGTRPAWRERLSALRQSVQALVSEPSTRLWRAAAFDLVFHALAVVEVFVTLRWLLGERSPTLVQAIGFEAVNRFITVALKFVPFRVGVDEASSGALAPLLAVQVTTGVTLAVVRKVRVLIWSAVGLALIARGRRHPATPGMDRP